MSEPLNLVLEFLRTENVDDEYAFRVAKQTYSLRFDGGIYEKAVVDWGEALLTALNAVRLPGRDPEVVRRLGNTLSGILGGTHWTRYAEQILAASSEKRPIFVTIRSAAAELYALPWELLTLNDSGLQLGAIPNLLVRYEWPRAKVVPPSAAAQQEGGRILFAWSGQVPVNEHLAAIETAAQKGDYPYQRETDQLEHVSVARLHQALTAAQKDGPPITVLHLLCHGAADANGKTFGLSMNSDDPGKLDTPVIVDAGALQRLLAPFAEMLRLVVLSACDSGNMGALGNQLGSIAQGLHCGGIAAVVASRFPLSVRGSNELTDSLYHSLLVDSLSLEQSLCLARQKLLELTTELDWASVQFYGRGEPQGQLRPLVIRPYRGLLPFQPEHHRFLFGRKDELEHLLQMQSELEKAGKPRLLMVLGTAGAGKSSLVLAGLCQKVLTTRPGSSYRVMRPSADPDAMLESTLADVRESRATDGHPGDLGPLLLIIDKLEDLFTQVADGNQRQAFMQRLWQLACDPVGHVHVVITMRIEQMARCAELSVAGQQHLDSVVSNPAHRFIVGRLDPKNFKDVIEKPAQVVGLTLEGDLCERLLADASELTGAQPLLEDVLDLLWQNRSGNVLTLAAYDAIGHISGALESRAEKLIQSFDDRKRHMARRLFVRLVNTSQDMTLLTRRCVSVDALWPSDPADNECFISVLSQLLEARLLSSSGDAPPDTAEAPSTRSDGMRISNRLPQNLQLLRSAISGPHRATPSSKPPLGDLNTLANMLRASHSGSQPPVPSRPGARPAPWVIEVAHEALIHKWGTLREWLRHDHLMVADIEKFEGWVKQWRDPKTQTLLGGHQLEYALELAKQYPSDLPPGAHELLAESTRRATWRRRWRKGLFGGFVLATLALIGLSYSTYSSFRRAKGSATSARDALRVMMASENQSDPLVRVHLLRSVEASDPLQLHGWLKLATETLHDLLPATREIVFSHGEEVIGISADCHTVVTSRPDEIVRVYQVGSSTPFYTHSGHRDRINAASLSRDGQLLVTASSDSTARIFKLGSQDEPVVLHGDPASGALVDARFGQDLKQIATLAEDGSVRLYQRNGSRAYDLPLAQKTAVLSLDYSPDGTRLLTGASDGSVYLFDRDVRVQGGVALTSKVLSAAFSADGHELILASDDQLVRLFRTNQLAESSDRGPAALALLSPTQGQPITPGLSLRRAVLSPDGQQVLTIHDTQARLFSRHDATRPAILSGPSDPLVTAGFCADGQRLYTIWRGGRLMLWQKSHQPFELALSVLPLQDVSLVHYSPDGRHLALVTGGRLAQLWNADGSGTPRVLAGHRSGITALTWGPDNVSIATASEDGTIGLWKDADGGSPTFLSGHRGAITHLAFSADGRLVASAGADRQLLLWNAEDNSERNKDDHHATPTQLPAPPGKVMSLEFARDGRHLLVLTEDGSAGATAAWSLELINTDPQVPPDVLHHGQLLGASLSPDGLKAAAVLADGTLRVWPLDGRSGVSTFHAAGSQPLTLARFSLDSRLLLAATNQDLVLFDPARPEQPGHTFAPHLKSDGSSVKSQRVQALVPLADTHRFIAVLDGRVVLVTDEGEIQNSIDTTLLGTSRLTAVSPAGGSFVSLDLMGTVWLFTTEPQQEKLALALLRRLWQASGSCAAPRRPDQPATEHARLGLLSVGQLTCEALQHCLKTHHGPEQFSTCYDRYRLLHLAAYE